LDESTLDRRCSRGFAAERAIEGPSGEVALKKRFRPAGRFQRSPPRGTNSSVLQRRHHKGGRGEETSILSSSLARDAGCLSSSASGYREVVVSVARAARMASSPGSVSEPAPDDRGRQPGLREGIGRRKAGCRRPVGRARGLKTRLQQARREVLAPIRALWRNSKGRVGALAKVD